MLRIDDFNLHDEFDDFLNNQVNVYHFLVNREPRDEELGFEYDICFGKDCTTQDVCNLVDLFFRGKKKDGGYVD